jgi:hypothetical protein
MTENFDTWGNLHGDPQKLIEEAHGDNFVKVSIYQVGDFYALGFQLKVGTLIRQKAANIGGAVFKTPGAAREAAGKEIEAICAMNKNSKKFFAEFSKICYTECDLFGGLYEFVR